MNVPAIARKTFEELRLQNEYMSIVNFVVSKLKKITNPSKKARFIHKTVDSYNEEVFSHPLVKQLSPCKVGCTACCYTQVSVTQDEAELLGRRVEQGLDIDRSRLKIQMAAKNDSEQYFKIRYEDRRCIFLDENGACRVYEDRPSVCRTNAVIGSSSQCDTSSTIQPTRLVRTPKSDMVIYASFLDTESSGTLPFMLAKFLKMTE